MSMYVVCIMCTFANWKDPLLIGDKTRALNCLKRVYILTGILFLIGNLKLVSKGT